MLFALLPCTQGTACPLQCYNTPGSVLPRPRDQSRAAIFSSKIFIFRMFLWCRVSRESDWASNCFERPVARQPTSWIGEKNKQTAAAGVGAPPVAILFPHLNPLPLPGQGGALHEPSVPRHKAPAQVVRVSRSAARRYLTTSFCAPDTFHKRPPGLPIVHLLQRGARASTIKYFGRP